jgi:hypothetical protein
MEPSLTPTSNLPSWLQAVGGLLTVSRSAGARSATSVATASAPAPSVAVEGIAAEDWDLLFQAVLEVLGQAPVDRAAASAQLGPSPTPDARLRECLTALDLLRRSVKPATECKKAPAPREDGRTTTLVARPQASAP